MKKILISTWCTDDYAELLGLDKLINSVKYFHPEVDHVIFDTKMTEQIHEQLPWMKPIWMMSTTCLPFVENYDMVIHLDADAVVTGPMTEFFESDEDIIGVRNNNSLDNASCGPGITVTHLPPFGNGEQIPIQNFINAGMIGANSKQFWYDWHSLNVEAARIKREVNPYAHGIGDEQDTLNQIFNSDKYSTKIVDAMGTGVSYGLCSTWGQNTHWDSWSQIYVKDDRLYLDDPKTGEPMCIKVMHQAGGHAAAKLNREAGGFRNWLSSVVSDEVNDYLNEVQNG
jgi:hypothetical protein|tara:strand:- start:1584 stop:2435 length:852 start_codon:yes stop_codon:yes gene_type:complete